MSASKAKDDSMPVLLPVLCVGLTVVDMVTVAEAYPQEDSDQRAISFCKQRGGNASNTCTVLSCLDTKCEYLGVLPDSSSPEHSWLMKDFTSRGVVTKGCVFSSQPCPVATVIVSRQTGSRTILFCANDQPELSWHDFLQGVSDRLQQFDWIHFELRPNVDDYLKMMETVKAHHLYWKVHHRNGPSQTISAEIEKPEVSKLVAEQVMMKADVVFISKDWARCQGWMDMLTAVREASKMCQQDTVVVCPWGDEGAAAWCNHEVIAVQAVPPDKVVDTLGAGDTFIGGFVHARRLGLSVEATMNFACRLAGYKCGMEGFEGLKNFDPLLE